MNSSVFLALGLYISIHAVVLQCVCLEGDKADIYSVQTDGTFDPALISAVNSMLYVPPFYRLPGVPIDEEAHVKSSVYPTIVSITAPVEPEGVLMASPEASPTLSVASMAVASPVPKSTIPAKNPAVITDQLDAPTAATTVLKKNKPSPFEKTKKVPTPISLQEDDLFTVDDEEMSVAPPPANSNVKIAAEPFIDFSDDGEEISKTIGNNSIMEVDTIVPDQENVPAPKLPKMPSLPQTAQDGKGTTGMRSGMELVKIPRTYMENGYMSILFLR